MNIQLQTQGFELTPAIDAFVHEQLQFHLANFESQIVSVDVYLRDINGPKGGPDKKVLFRIQLLSRLSIKVERTRSDLYVAVTNASRQAKRAVRRSLNKRRRMEKAALRDLSRLSRA